MLIQHRGLYPNRFDAPFMGTLIFAKDCHHNCKGCYHQERRSLQLIEEDSESIINKIKEDTYSSGIIFGGFEWSEQPEQLLELVSLAREYNLDVILYTHHTESELRILLPDLYKYKGIYIKYGEYDETKRAPLDYSCYDVHLATTNQYISIVD